MFGTDVVVAELERFGECCLERTAGVDAEWQCDGRGRLAGGKRRLEVRTQRRRVGELADRLRAQSVVGVEDAEQEMPRADRPGAQSTGMVFGARQGGSRTCGDSLKRARAEEIGKREHGPSRRVALLRGLPADAEVPADVGPRAALRARLLDVIADQPVAKPGQLRSHVLGGADPVERGRGLVDQRDE